MDYILLIILVVTLASALFLVGFWLMMLAHVFTSGSNDKLLWVSAMIVTGAIGSLIYYYVVYSPLRKQKKSIAR